jgi:hypothetical protein
MMMAFAKVEICSQQETAKMLSCDGGLCFPSDVYVLCTPTTCKYDSSGVTINAYIPTSVSMDKKKFWYHVGEGLCPIAKSETLTHVFKMYANHIKSQQNWLKLEEGQIALKSITLLFETWKNYLKSRKNRSFYLLIRNVIKQTVVIIEAYVSLLSTAYKNLSNILLSKSSPYAEEIIGDHQWRFRRNKSHSAFSKQLS